MRKTIAYGLSFLVVLVMCYAFQTQQSNFDAMVNREIKNSVPTISTEHLKKMIDTRANFTLLDTRELDEYNVSKIAQARWVGYNHFNIFALNDLNKNDTLVVYCSIGVRSEQVGEKLKKFGFKNVFNLFGGIFRWVNLSYPLVDHRGNATQKIHPYNDKWGKWLFKGIKSYE